MAKSHILFLNVDEMVEATILDIRIRLIGEVKDHFLKIKNAKGLTNNTEVLRLIINEYFEKNLLNQRVR